MIDAAFVQGGQCLKQMNRQGSGFNPAKGRSPQSLFERSARQPLFHQKDRVFLATNFMDTGQVRVPQGSCRAGRLHHRRAEIFVSRVHPFERFESADGMRFFVADAVHHKQSTLAASFKHVVAGGS